MPDPLQRAVPLTPLRPSASAWNRMLDAAKATESGARNPSLGGTPYLVVSVRNDTGGDLAAFAVVRLGDSILDVTTPLRVAPTPTFEGLTPEGPTDAFAVLLEPAKVGKFALAVVSGVVPCGVNVTNADHDFAAPGTTTERLTSAASGPARILDRSADTGEVDAVVLLGGGGGGSVGSPGSGSGGGACALAGLRTEDCVTVTTAGDDYLLTWDAGASKWTSADTFDYPTGSGVFAFWYSAGSVHLSLDGLELLDCGNGCFSGGPLTGHDGQTGVDACDGPAFTVCVACSSCEGQVCTACPDDPFPLTITITFTGFGNCGPIAGAIADATPYTFVFGAIGVFGSTGWGRVWEHDYGTHIAYLYAQLTCIGGTDVELAFRWVTSTSGFVGAGAFTGTMDGVTNTCDPLSITFPAGSYVSGSGTEPGCSGDIASFAAVVTE